MLALVSAAFVGSSLAVALVPLAPGLTPGPVIIALPDAHVRDCAPPLPWGGRYHTFCTHVPIGPHGDAGYFGAVHHFFSRGADPFEAPWQTSGAALNASAAPWESFGVFTPGAAVDSSVDPPLWRLVYGAVGANFTRDWPFKNFTEAIGVASSPSPFGPWLRSPHNPVASPGPRGSFFEARVDNARPNWAAGFGSGPALLIKGVQSDFTALPGLWLPAAAGAFDGPWLPPRAPLVNASAARDKGFENQEVFWGPDGLLHMVGQSHGCSTAPRCNQHFASRDAGATWAFAGKLGEDLQEPAPIYNGTAPPTDAPPLGWIQFFGDAANGNRLSVRVAAITWSSPAA
jgi:hypothetical protein